MSSSADVRLGIWGMAMTRAMRSPRLAAMSSTTAADLPGACLTQLREAMTVTVTLSEASLGMDIIVQVCFNDL